MRHILLTGGTGLVGSRLTRILTDRGHRVTILSRSVHKGSGLVGYKRWSVGEGFIEDGALDGVDHIVHLAGAGVIDKRWTDKRKNEIVDSRVESATLLGRVLAATNHSVRSMVCASAVGYYGSRGDQWLKESDAPGEDFLPEVCVKWEAASRLAGQSAGVPTALLRIGIVLSHRGGALPQLAGPARFGIGACLGSGDQYYPWIHIDDLCRMFLFAVFNGLTGPYNASAPQPMTNRSLAKTIAYVLQRPFIPVPAPAFALKLAMGERGGVLLNSQRTSSARIREAGFVFEHPDAENALRDIFLRKV